jgi:hypothetical protein
MSIEISIQPGKLYAQNRKKFQQSARLIRLSALDLPLLPIPEIAKQATTLYIGCLIQKDPRLGEIGDERLEIGEW